MGFAPKNSVVARGRAPAKRICYRNRNVVGVKRRMAIMSREKVPWRVLCRLSLWLLFVFLFLSAADSVFSGET